MIFSRLFARYRCLAALALLALGSGLATAQAPHVYPVSGDVAGTHDPSLIKEGATWYVFATGKAPDGGQLPVRCSNDLEHWTLCGHVFDAIPTWIQERSPRTKGLWAPDISFVNHEFRMYYSYSSFGKNTSGIALAVNKTLDAGSPDFKWIDKGLVLESTAEDNFNAIDPNFVQDEHGHAWLTFGSFWDGIKMRRLDDGSGLLSMADQRVYSLARRAKTGVETPHPGLPANSTAIEAPFIVRYDGFFYLFTSWEFCCRGVKSTYRTMVGRASSITGPYLDESGEPLLDGGGTELLTANERWLGPGGESVLINRHGKDLIVFHAYDATTGRPSMQLSTIEWSGGWPHAALER